MLPNLGFGHLLVIIVVGLIVFGPSKLPEMMRKFGKAWRLVQSEAEKASAELRSVVDDGSDLTSVSSKVVNDTPDAMAIKKEAEIPEPTTAHAPKPRKTPAAKKKSAAKKSAPAKKTAAKKAKRPAAPAYPLHEDT